VLAQKSEPIFSIPRSHAESKNRFEQILKKYEGCTEARSQRTVALLIDRTDKVGANVA